MADSNAKSSDRPRYCRDATWYPLRTGWEQRNISNQNFGLPGVLAPADLSWLEGVFRWLAGLSWPGYMWCAPIHPRFQQELWGRGAEVKGEPYNWRVSLDVSHFFPTELSVRTTENGFLEISGKHGERQDEHGLIARSFTRKYKLPIGIEAQTIRTSLSGNGILIVEAPLPTTPKPQMFIPVQLEKESGLPGETKKKEESKTETAIENKQRREMEGQDAQFTNRKPSPTSPTRPMWVPKEEHYWQGQQADQVSAEFSSREGVQEALTHEEGARDETQDQFTDLSEAPATPDTLTSDQEGASDVAHDREAQQQQDHHHQQDGEPRDGSDEVRGIYREGSGEERSRGLEQVSCQFQDFIVPEQEVQEGQMPQ